MPAYRVTQRSNLLLQNVKNNNFILENESNNLLLWNLRIRISEHKASYFVPKHYPFRDLWIGKTSYRNNFDKLLIFLISNRCIQNFILSVTFLFLLKSLLCEREQSKLITPSVYSTLFLHYTKDAIILTHGVQNQAICITTINLYALFVVLWT